MKVSKQATDKVYDFGLAKETAKDYHEIFW